MIKSKEELIFQDNFIEKIKQGTKTKTMRNSPVTLGVKKLSDDFSIDVYKVERVLAYEASFNMEDVYHIISIDEDYPTINEWATSCEPFGFNTLEEMYNYYKAYLKRDDAYLIHFKFLKEN